MYIHEAIRARTPDHPCIHRRAWDETLFPGRKICIDPTSEWVCCIAYGVDGLIGPSWNPQASDLLAEDWEPCPRPPVPKEVKPVHDEEHGSGCLSWLVSVLVSVATAVLLNLWLDGRL